MAEFLTVAEMAKRLRATPDTVRKWARLGLIPSMRVNAKGIRFDPDTVAEVMARHAAAKNGGAH